MTWFKLDDQVTFHAKTVRAGNEAFGAFCRAGAYASALGTDGFIPEDIGLLIAPAHVWAKLVAVRFAHVSEGGWMLHDFLEWNPSAKETEKLRAARSRAGKKGARGSSKSSASAPASAQQVPGQVLSKTSGDVPGKRPTNGRAGPGMGSGSPDGGAGGASSARRSAEGPTAGASGDRGRRGRPLSWEETTMPTTQQIVNRDMVRRVAREIDPTIYVALVATADGHVLELSAPDGTVEQHATAEEAIEALRASWGRR